MVQSWGKTDESQMQRTQERTAVKPAARRTNHMVVGRKREGGYMERLLYELPLTLKQGLETAC